MGINFNPPFPQNTLINFPNSPKSPKVITNNIILPELSESQTNKM